MAGEIAELGREAMTGVLYKAIDNIEDEEILAYYLKLLDGYNLEENSAGNSPAEQTALTEQLPDIYRINCTAASLPLTEAEKTIQDGEIAAFYSDFLKHTGWTSE